MAKRKKERAKEGFFKRNYLLSWMYIKESRRYIYFTIAVFLIFILIGFFKPVYFVELIKRFIEQLRLETAGLNSWQMIVFIWLNNIKSAFFGLILGVALGIFPLFNLIINGYVIGFVSYYAVQGLGYSSLLSYVPHGIFELPALVISLALGMRFGMFLFTKDKKKEFLYRLDRSLRVFIFVILSLLLIAGVIEGLFITLI
jgi:stage II sporulation protein M